MAHLDRLVVPRMIPTAHQEELVVLLVAVSELMIP
jgi:hypothetical protein